MMVFCLMSMNGFGQKFYVSLNAGFSTDSDPSVFIGNSSNATDYYPILHLLMPGYVTYGTGIRYGGTAGYAISKKFFFEIEGSYFSSVVLTGAGTNWYHNVYEAAFNISSSAKTWCFTPIIKYNLRRIYLSPYISIGMPILTGGSITNEATITTKYSLYNYTRNTSLYLYGGSSLGFKISGGMEFHVYDNISFLFNLNYTSLKWSPTHGKLTKYIFNGIDSLGLLSVSQKEFNLSRSASANPYYLLPITSVPTTIDGSINDFSYIGFNVGIKYQFAIKKKKEEGEKK